MSDDDTDESVEKDRLTVETEDLLEGQVATLSDDDDESDGIYLAAEEDDE